jgi:hypothetical protein
MLSAMVDLDIPDVSPRRPNFEQPTSPWLDQHSPTEVTLRMRKLIVPSLLAAALVTFAASAYAGPGCSTSKSAGSGSACNYSKSKTAALPEGLQIETVRMPSGALAVLYSSNDVETVKAMQEKAALGASSFDCGICRQMASSSECTVELVAFSNGVIAFVTSESPESIDAYENQFAALTSAEAATATQ